MGTNALTCLLITSISAWSSYWMPLFRVRIMRYKYFEIQGFSHLYFLKYIVVWALQAVLVMSPDLQNLRLEPMTPSRLDQTSSAINSLSRLRVTNCTTPNPCELKMFEATCIKSKRHPVMRSYEAYCGLDHSCIFSEACKQQFPIKRN